MTDRTPMYQAACEAHANEQTVDADWAALLWADELDEAGDHNRAEFVRVQCELGRLVGTGRVHRDSPVMRMDVDYLCGIEHPGGSSIPRIVELRKRDRDLLRSHEDAWRWAGECPECEGKGTIGLMKKTAGRWSVTTENGPCKACFGSGDVGGLLQRQTKACPQCIHWKGRVPKSCACKGTRRVLSYRDPVQFRRGLIDAVTVPRRDDVLEPRIGFDRKGPDCGVDWTGRNGFPCCCAWASSHHGDECPEHGKTGIPVPEWLPTPWALAVARHHRSVTRLVVEEWEPDGPNHGESELFAGALTYDWWSEDVGDRQGNPDVDQLPDPVMDVLREMFPRQVTRAGRGVEFDTPAAALDAAAVALCRFVRKSLKEDHAPADDTDVPSHGGS